MFIIAELLATERKPMTWGEVAFMIVAIIVGQILVSKAYRDKGR